MNEAEWRERLGGMVRDYIRSPELEHYFSIKMTKPRAAIMVTQQSLLCAPSARMLGACLGQLSGPGGQAADSRTRI